MGQKGGEFASLVQAGTQQTGDLLDQRLRRHEGVVLLGCRDKRGRRHPLREPDKQNSTVTEEQSGSWLLYHSSSGNTCSLRFVHHTGTCWHERVSRKLTELFHQFLVLVELLEGFSVHAWQVVGLGLVAVLLVSQDTHLKLWPRNVLQPARR